MPGQGMNRFSDLVDQLSAACAVVAGLLLVASIVTVTWMVLWRTLGHQNSWELDISIMMMVGAVFLASPYTLHTHGHVGMELLDAVLSDDARERLAIAGRVIGFCVCAYLAWMGLTMTVDAFRGHERSLGIVPVPEWPKYATMPIGMGLTALQYVAEIHRARQRRTLRLGSPS